MSKQNLNLNNRTYSRHKSVARTTQISQHSQNCPLSDPSIGPVSENDHRVGTCLCSYCTCGAHGCPSLQQRAPYPRHTFRTKYRNEFTQKRFDQALHPGHKPYVRNTQKSDFMTTYQRELQPYEIQYQRDDVRPYTPEKAKFLGKSVYANEFPNWGPPQVQRQTHLYRPVRSTELRFLGGTQYGNSFKPFEKDKVDLYKSKISDLDAFGSKIKIGVNNQFNPETTHRREHQDYSSNGLNHRVTVRAQDPAQTYSTGFGFKTTTNEFHNKLSSPTKDPRQLKNYLASTVR